MIYDTDFPVKTITNGSITQRCGFWHKGRRLPYNLLMYITEGQLTVRVNRVIYEMRHGDILIVPQGIRYEPLETDGCSYHYFHFNIVNNKAESLDSENRNQEFRYTHICEPDSVLHLDVLTRTNDSPRILEIFRRLPSISPYRNPAEKLLIDNALKEILILASQEIHISVKQHKTFLDVVEYIKENYYMDITATKLSRRFRVSPNCLARIFRENLGITTMDFLNKVRVDNASALIFEAHKPLEEIATYVGFKNKSSFSRMFKRFRGISPIAYKRNIKLTEKTP